MLPAREQGDVTPLVQTVKRWWFEADAWRDPQAQREFQARIDTYRDGGPPPAEQRMSRDPVQYQRCRDERDDVSMPLRSLHFGPDGAGLVTFLVYPPDDLVLVVEIQWPGG